MHLGFFSTENSFLRLVWWKSFYKLVMFKCSNGNDIYKNHIGKLFIRMEVIYFINSGWFHIRFTYKEAHPSSLYFNGWKMLVFQSMTERNYPHLYQTPPAPQGLQLGPLFPSCSSSWLTLDPSIYTKPTNLIRDWTPGWNCFCFWDP